MESSVCGSRQKQQGVQDRGSLFPCSHLLFSYNPDLPVCQKLLSHRLILFSYLFSSAPLISATMASTAARDASPKFSAPYFA